MNVALTASGSALATNECDGLDVCISVPGPWVVVPGSPSGRRDRMRRGDFSELLALGPQYQIYNPLTTRPSPTTAGRFVRDPIPGNIIPPAMISQVAGI